MRTTCDSLPAERGLWGVWGSINRFFFQPSDTATLGLIRICAGFLILYVHAMYSYQLYQLFGKDAWISADLIHDIRTQSPIVTPETSWPQDEWFKVTDASLNSMNRARVPEAITYKLRPLIDREIQGRRYFNQELKKLLGREDLERYQNQISYAAQLEAAPKGPPPSPDKVAQEEAFRAKWLNADPNFDLNKIYVRGQYVWSVWFHVTDPTWIAVVHVGILVCMLLFALGLWTPATGIVTWLGMLSYVNRATTTFFGMDTIMNVLVIYLTLAHLFARPGTAALSLDRLLWRFRNARQMGLNMVYGPAAGSTLSSSATFAVRLMQMHFCLIYLASGLTKLMGSAWWNGWAIWGVSANPEFNPLHNPYYFKMLSWLAAHRALWEFCMTGGTAYTLAVEISLPFLIWNRKLRWVMVIGAVLLHTGIALSMGLVGFSLMMLALLVSFIPSETVRQLLGLTERLPALLPAGAAAPQPAGAVGVRG